jgi:voltage-gated potassium channel Kch
MEKRLVVRFIVGLGSILLIVAVLVDAFEAVLLPRRVSHGFRFVRFYYRNTWRFWRHVVNLISSPRRRATALSLFGPLALLALFATWAFGLIAAFASLHWSLQTPMAAGKGVLEAGEYLYFSGVTFFTLGYGDVTPQEPLGKFLAVVETGLGFGFLAVIISYHPVLTQAFSRREIVISLLDARGGSPPTAAQVLIRNRQAGASAGVSADLAAWETWSAELLESCLSFPMLAFYRSQHDNQSWLAALTAVLDTCALQICGAGDADLRQARLTFAIARHAAVDLTLVFYITPVPPELDRLPPESLERLKGLLTAKGVSLTDGTIAAAKLAELRGMYEPFLNGLARFFLFQLPDFLPERSIADNWQTSAWMPCTPGILSLPGVERGEHFE